jgi:hypothetical protein
MKGGEVIDQLSYYYVTEDSLLRKCFEMLALLTCISETRRSHLSRDE